MAYRLAISCSDALPARPEASGLADAVESLLSLPESALDYAELKLAFDAMAFPELNSAAARAELDRLTIAARALAGARPSENAALGALHTCIYRPGPWNGDRPFAYDQADPSGQTLANAVLANYLERRRGNCIAMPILLLILGDRLGLDVTLATAPLHVFVRLRRQDGTIVNLEATSGGHPARDAWYREQMPMSDLAVANGVYLRTLSRRESAALMATIVVAQLMMAGRYVEAEAVAGVILRHDPRNAHLLAGRGSAIGFMLRTEFEEKYSRPWLIPIVLRPRYRFLAMLNEAYFTAAEALGWEPVDP